MFGAELLHQYCTLCSHLSDHAFGKQACCRRPLIATPQCVGSSSFYDEVWMAVRYMLYLTKHSCRQRSGFVVVIDHLVAMAESWSSYASSISAAMHGVLLYTCSFCWASTEVVA